jgi:hypothetical protein
MGNANRAGGSLPSMTAPETSGLLTRMEGGFSRIKSVRSSVIKKAIGNFDEFELRVKTCNRITDTIRVGDISLRDVLSGLSLSFEIKTLISSRDVLSLSFTRILGACVVVVYVNVSPSLICAPRVTTPRGFTYLTSQFEDLKSALETLSRVPSEVNKKKNHGEDDEVTMDKECPICMDRPVDVVLSCTHAFCRVCQTEWLVGEGRGTCPLCRSKENERDDWVLNENVDVSAEGVNAIIRRAEAVVRNIFEFLSNLPTWYDFTQSPGFGQFYEAEQDLNLKKVFKSGSDGLQWWLLGELRVLEGYYEVNTTVTTTSHYTKTPEMLCRCPICTTASVLPQNAEESHLFLCRGCQQLITVADLELVGESIFHSEGLFTQLFRDDGNNNNNTQ